MAVLRRRGSTNTRRGGKTRLRAQRPRVVGAAHHPDAIAGGEPTRPRQRRGQQALAVDHLQERLGATLARRRPEALAGAAGEDHRVQPARGAAARTGRALRPGHQRPTET